MKTKRILSILLTMVLAFGLLVIMSVTAGALAPPASPATTTWDFDSTPADSSGSYGSGSWSWVQSTKTLILTDITFTTSNRFALELPADATIVLNGTNSIASTFSGASSTSGIYTNGNLTINGSGSLSAAGGIVTGGYAAAGIFVATGTLTIESGTVNATGFDAGIDARSGLIINGGTVSATGDYGIVVEQQSSLSLTGGTFTAIGSSRALFSKYTVPYGCKYYVNTTADPNLTERIGNGSTTKISTQKYAKVLYANETPPAVRGILGTSPKWDGAWWHFVLFFIGFGFFWMWF